MNLCPGLVFGILQQHLFKCKIFEKIYIILLTYLESSIKRPGGLYIFRPWEGGGGGGCLLDRWAYFNSWVLNKTWVSFSKMIPYNWLKHTINFPCITMAFLPWSSICRGIVMPDIPTEERGDVLTIGTWEFWSILCVLWHGRGKGAYQKT